MADKWEAETMGPKDFMLVVLTSRPEQGPVSSVRLSKLKLIW